MPKLPSPNLRPRGPSQKILWSELRPALIDFVVEFSRYYNRNPTYKEIATAFGRTYAWVCITLKRLQTEGLELSVDRHSAELSWSKQREALVNCLESFAEKHRRQPTYQEIGTYLGVSRQRAHQLMVRLRQDDARAKLSREYNLAIRHSVEVDNLIKAIDVLEEPITATDICGYLSWTASRLNRVVKQAKTFGRLSREWRPAPQINPVGRALPDSYILVETFVSRLIRIGSNLPTQSQIAVRLEVDVSTVRSVLAQHVRRGEISAPGLPGKDRRDSSATRQKVARAVEKLEHRLGREPSRLEIAAELGISSEKARYWFEMALLAGDLGPATYPLPSLRN